MDAEQLEERYTRMGTPASIEARLFYRCAYQRHHDAHVLLRADRTTGAVYLAGYGVECILKALILEGLTHTDRKIVLASFRGALAHNITWLRSQYLQHKGAKFPREITEAFTFVHDWSTDLRYMPRPLKYDEAQDFLSAVERIISWANERF